MWFIIIVVVGIIIWMAVAALKSDSEKTSQARGCAKSVLNDSTSSDIQNTRMDDPFNLGIEHMLLKEAVNTFYDCIDNVWSWADDEHYNAFKSKEQYIRLFLFEKSGVLLSVSPESEKAQMFMTFIMFQGFAYSYYIVMGLEQELPGDADSVTASMTEVFETRGYLSGGLNVNGKLENTIQRMIEEKDEIVYDTRLKRN